MFALYYFTFEMLKIEASFIANSQNQKDLIIKRIEFKKNLAIFILLGLVAPINTSISLTSYYH